MNASHLDWPLLKKEPLSFTPLPIAIQAASAIQASPTHQSSASTASPVSPISEQEVISEQDEGWGEEDLDFGLEEEEENIGEKEERNLREKFGCFDFNQIQPGRRVSEEQLYKDLDDAYPVMTQGKFTEAASMFKSILHLCLTSDPNSHVVYICKEYLLGLLLETSRRDLPATALKRNLELASYFTTCDMQSVHLQLAIRHAMVQSFKLKNFKQASHFASRLLQESPAPAVAQSAQRIIQHCERITTDEIMVDYNFNGRNEVCADSLVLLNGVGKECRFCKAKYRREYSGVCKVCVVCKVE